MDADGHREVDAGTGSGAGDENAVGHRSLTVIVLQRAGHEYGFIVEPGQQNRQRLIWTLGQMATDPELELFDFADATDLLNAYLEIHGATT